MLVAWKSALIGLLVSSAVILAFCSIYYISADTASERTSSVFRSDYADFLRSNAKREAVILCSAVGAYWCMSALGGRGHVASIKLANYLLGTAIAIIMLLTSNSYFFGFETICDQFPQSHTGFSVLRIHECPSSEIAIGGLEMTSALLALVSLIVRIVVSRRNVSIKL